mmetsp:Transcript_21912/g.61021  ORF Transcript_21912/g.61021 Transcript_21912/m.61021 type:complete len:279 (-) Transcript_21912:42-878(-)
MQCNPAKSISKNHLRSQLHIRLLTPFVEPDAAAGATANPRLQRCPPYDYSALRLAASSQRFWKRAVERYRSPKDGMMVTTRLPAISGLLATSTAARTAAPDEIPQKMPSDVASRRAMAMASSPGIWMTSSSREVSALPGMNPAPMPWILCGPGDPPEMTADSAGSTAMSCMEGFMGLRNCPVPVSVPPVPTPPTRASMLPPVSRQISGPVVSRWIFGLSGLLNCWRRKPPCEEAISSALEMAPPIPLAAGVRTTSAPKALRRTRLSMLMLSGMVRMSL